MNEPEQKKPCEPGKHHFNVICCGGEAGEDRDIIECCECGERRNVKCDFDDEYS